MNILYRIRKKHFVYTFFGIILILFIIRLIFPSVLRKTQKTEEVTVQAPSTEEESDTIDLQSQKADAILFSPHRLHPDLKAGAKAPKHKIYSVSDYARCFPDINDIQLPTAKRLGVEPVANRAAAEDSKDKLVYIGNSPYYYVKRLYNSIPYLVPRAQMLLTRVARNFLDSQYVKHVNPSMIIVTSITRSREDVADLRRFNRNASENSCHQYGTTFDVSYTKYHAVQDPDGPRVRETRNDTLRFILSEVLEDLHQQGACYVKYERHQGCYHITVR